MGRESVKKGELFEKNRREYWSNRSGVVDVHRDTYGKTDLAVFKKTGTILLIECKRNGLLKQKDRSDLKTVLRETPENVQIRVEFVEDLESHCGKTNTTYTKIREPEDVERHIEKVNRMRRNS